METFWGWGRWAAAAAVVVTLGCANKQVVAVDEDADGVPTLSRPLHKIMQEHFVHADAVQKGVIAGDLEATKVNAQWITDHHVAGLGRNWQPHIDALTKAAEVVTSAPDLAQASVGAAKIAGACGGCHQAHGMNLQLGAPPVEEADDLQSQMRRHQWAANRMWDSVVGNDDEAWKQASTMLSNVPLILSPDAVKASPDLEVVARLVHDIGAQSIDVTDPRMRVLALGDLLATCAACHGVLHAEAK